MSLRRKTLIVVLVAAVSLICIFLIPAYTILLNSYIALERQDSEQTMHQVVSSVTRELDTLVTQTRDYAHWDDTFTFVQDGNAEYIGSNLYSETFINNRVALMLYLNAAHETVFSQAYDAAGEQLVPVPPTLLALVRRDMALLEPLNADGTPNYDGVGGVVVLPEGVLLLAASTILPSDLSPTPGGTLLWGRWLDAALLATLGEQLEAPLRLYTYNAPDLPTDFEAVRAPDRRSRRHRAALELRNNRQLCAL
ncbi:MAG: hypothetical protein HXY40_08320 [Chloroflexi bacterium]|nr:hypothetical protein [Chloroflexota bacterium]